MDSQEVDIFWSGHAWAYALDGKELAGDFDKLDGAIRDAHKNGFNIKSVNTTRGVVRELREAGL